jgi:hypothetical protein
MKKTMVLSLVTAILAACAPSAQTVQTAIAQTQTAGLTTTLTPDLLALQFHLKNLLLQNIDLPLDAKYHLP